MITIDMFGKDHWSTFMYVETRVVDHGGVLNNEHMRCDPNIHPQFSNRANDISSDPCATIVKDGKTIDNHDDWSCVDDLEAAGLLISSGTGLHPIFSLTEKGWSCANMLRQHKAAGKSFKDFSWGQL